MGTIKCDPCMLQLVCKAKASSAVQLDTWFCTSHSAWGRPQAPITTYIPSSRQRLWGARAPPPILAWAAQLQPPRVCGLPAHHLAVRPGVAAAPQHAIGMPADDLAAPKVHPAVVALRIAHLRDHACLQASKQHCEDRASAWHEEVCHEEATFRCYATHAWFDIRRSLHVPQATVLAASESRC